MDEDLEQLKKQVARLYEITLDTNKVVHRMQRAERWARALSYFKWLVIIGITVASYYLLAPIVEQYVTQVQGMMQMGQRVTGDGAEGEEGGYLQQALKAYEEFKNSGQHGGTSATPPASLAQ